MNKILNYGRLILIFIILELFVTFIMSFLNLLGVNSGITTILLLLLNVIIFFVLNFINAHKEKQKGYLQGIILGILFLLFMFLIKIILFHSGFKISTVIYYIILFIVSILGGMFGVNKKSDE